MTKLELQEVGNNCGYWELNPDPLQEQQVLLTLELHWHYLLEEHRLWSHSGVAPFLALSLCHLGQMTMNVLLMELNHLPSGFLAVLPGDMWAAPIMVPWL